MRKNWLKAFLLLGLLGLASCQTGNDDDDDVVIDSQIATSQTPSVVPGTKLTLLCTSTCGQTANVTPTTASVRDLVGSWKGQTTGAVLTFTGTRGQSGTFSFVDEKGVNGTGHFIVQAGNIIAMIDASATTNPFLQAGLQIYSLTSISPQQVELTLSPPEAAQTLRLVEMRCSGTCGQANRGQPLANNNLTLADAQGTWTLQVPAEKGNAAITLTFKIQNNGEFSVTDSNGGQSSGRFTAASDIMSLNFTASTNPLIEQGSVQFFRVINASTSLLNLQQISSSEATLNATEIAFNFKCLTTNCGTTPIVSPSAATIAHFVGRWKTENIPGLPLTFDISSSGAVSFTDDANQKSGKGTFSINAGIATVNIQESTSPLLAAGVNFYRITALSGVGANAEFQLTQVPENFNQTLHLACQGTCGTTAEVTPSTATASNLTGTWKTTQGRYNFTLTLNSDQTFSLAMSTGKTAKGTFKLTEGILQFTFTEGLFFDLPETSLTVILASVDRTQLILSFGF